MLVLSEGKLRYTVALISAKYCGIVIFSSHRLPYFRSIIRKLSPIIGLGPHKWYFKSVAKEFQKCLVLINLQRNLQCNVDSRVFTTTRCGAVVGFQIPQIFDPHAFIGRVWLAEKSTSRLSRSLRESTSLKEGKIRH